MVSLGTARGLGFGCFRGAAAGRFLLRALTGIKTSPVPVRLQPQLSYNAFQQRAGIVVLQL